MKRILSLTLSLALLTLVFSSVMARPANDGQKLIPMQVDLQPLTGAQNTDSRADTFFLFGDPGSGSEFGAPGTDGRGFTFDMVGGSSDCGWTTFDKTAQPDTYWHLETAMGLGSGTDMSGSLPFDAGDLVNDYAMHCGRWNVCGWAVAPDLTTNGYGNNWDQRLRVVCGDFATSANLNFNYISDFEGDVWDFFQVFIETYTGGVLTLQEIYVNQILHETTLLNLDLTVLESDYAVDSYGDFILRFSSDGAWSDEDGLLFTDVGAVWGDNFIVTRDGTELWRDDLETGVVPATLIPFYPAGAGDKAELYSNLYTQDVCSLNQSYSWAFFDLLTSNPNYPIPVIQYGPPYLDNDIRSPLLTMAHEVDNPVGTPMSLGIDTQVNLDFWVYADIPSDALIYYSWALASYTDELGCLGVYKNDNTVYYGDNLQWGIHHEDQAATQAVLESAQEGNVTGISIGLNCVDMCPFWCDSQGSGENHTPGPFLDIVRLSLVEASSVAWNVSGFHRLQDNFPEVADDGNGGAAGKVRIDSGYNVEPIASPTVVIGDSTMIELNMDGHGGIKESFSTAAGENRPELWMYFQVVAGPHAGMLNASMGDVDDSDGIFSPYEGTVADVVGSEPDWGLIRADYAAYQGGVQPGKYAFDFADNYFEAGDVIHYFYYGNAADNFAEYRPEWAQSSSLDLRARYIVRCLPTTGSLVLFCDDWNGTHFWWTEAFQYNGYAGYDTYTTQAPSSGLENGLSGRATEADISQYYCIVWDSGNLQDYAVTSLGSNDKTEDDVLLTNYLANALHPTALWMFGATIANDLGQGSGFLANVLGANLLSTSDHYNDVNNILVPRVSAVDPALTYLGGNPDFWVDGGCPSIEDFDLVEVNAVAPLATVSHEWEVQSSTEVAGIKNLDPDGNGTGVNEQGFANPVIFHPYSYYQVWDAGYALSASKDYARLQVGHVMELLLNCGPNVTPDAVPETPAYTKLEGNFPNPFNPKTAIRFSLSSSEHVSLAVYDISGRMVKELVNDKMVAGNHEIIWDGKNNSGNKAASGVYFYKMSAGDYSATDKMVMLK